jgi:uncharacterized protein
VTWSLQRRVIYAFLGLCALGLLMLAYAYFVEPRRLVVNRTEMRVSNWNPAFEGLKVALVSDIHGGSNAVDEAKIRKVVETTNAEMPDVIFLLGDFVSQRAITKSPDLKMPMSAIADALGGLKAKYGVFAVLGNHDGWYCDECVRRELTRVGYRVLENEVAVIEKDGAHLRIVGLPDQMKVGSWEQYSQKAKESLVPTDGTGDVIALDHSPDVLPGITAPYSISPDLKVVFAAHTHGGQVWFPVLGTPIVPSSYGQKYSYGHIRENGVDMFVTTGIGTSVLPFRFMVPPEIAVVTINAE